MAFSPTPEQQAAIDARGGSLLLSAAAGSGKTAVLTERAVSRMLDSDAPVSADRLLIVTFTRAAAAEMKERIVKKLSDYAALHPGDARVRRQRTLLDRACIGTIHSLCSQLLQQNFQLAGLPASFRIGDENELDALREEAVSSVLEEAYRTAEPAFLSLAELLSSSRSDKGLSDAILRVLSFARSHPFYREWLDKKLFLYRDFSSPEESVWADILFEYGQKLAEFAALRLRNALFEIASDDALAGYEEAFRTDLAAAEKISACAESRDWDGCREALTRYKPQRLGAVRKADPVRREALKAIRAEIKKILTQTLPEKIFCASGAEFAEDAKQLLPMIECLFSLAVRTDERLQEEKTGRGVLDFTDLEQLACSLLVGADGEKTPLAKEYAARFDEVMVDEYQDVNEVQSAILTALAKEDDFFCVGDVKQSIYRFRMAQPKLFLERAAACREYDGVHFPAVLRLNGSFRTAPAVTGVVNEVFSRLMSEEIGELVYDEKQSLTALGTFSAESEKGVRLCLIEDEDVADENGESPAEPVWTAGEIARLLREGRISDGMGTRPVEPRDIAILLRSPSSRAQHYRRALERAGIEAAVSLESGFLDTPEITAVLHVLHAASNPLRDVELLGAMTSPMFGFTDDELAAARVKTPAGRLWNAVLAAAREDAHAADFVQTLEELRRLALCTPPAELIGALLKKTSFDVLCRSMKNGAGREANLMLLMQYAAEPCGGGVPTLEGFLHRIDRLRERGKDLAPAAVGEGQNAVTITSIHKSKGLEWPIVFVCDCARTHSFYRNDLIEPTILHSELGFAAVRRDAASKRQFVTVPLAAVRTESERGLLSEELRVLYVAMTRAKERLYLTGAVKNPAARLVLAAQETAGQNALLPAQVRAGRSFLDWLLAALSLTHDLGLLARTGQAQEGLSVFAGSTFAPAPAVSKAEEPSPEADEALLLRLRAQITFSNPHEAASKLPAKLAVSALSHGGEERFFTGKPSFLEKGGLTGAARGTAVHAFLQYCNFEAAARDPQRELFRLRQNGVLTGAQADAVDLDRIRAFFGGELAQRIFSAERVLREFRFMAPASASALAAQYVLPDGEATMLQGVADCIVLERQGALLIDYKTDRVKEPQELARRYRTQLLLYRGMLGAALGVPVHAAALWSFALDCAVWVDLDE